MASTAMAGMNTLTPNPTPIHFHLYHHNHNRLPRPLPSPNTNRKKTTISLAAPHPPLRPLHRRHHSSAPIHASSHDADKSPNSDASAVPLEEGYVGLFVRMLGIDNDPLDREQAVSTLWKYSLGGKECVDEIMKFTGCVNLVVSLLNSESSLACEAAAGLLRSISSVSLYREAVAESGAIEEIAGALCRASLAPQVLEQCLCTLWNLSIDDELRLKIADSDLLFAFVKFLDNEDMRVKEAAGGILANLALSHCNHSRMVEAAAIPKLAEQLKCNVEGDKVVRKEAKSALMELSKDEFHKILIIEEGLIFVPVIGTSAYKSFRSVSRLWPSLPDGTEIKRNPSPSRYGASELLLGLSTGEKSELEETKTKAIVGRSRQQFLARIGAIELDDGGNHQNGSSTSERQTLLPWVDGVARLVLILELDDVSAISRAAHAISDALISEELRIYFKEAGAITRLIQLLNHNNMAVNEAAISALEKLCISTEICEMFESEKLLCPVINFLKSTSASKYLKEKTINILTRIFNPRKNMKAESTGSLINGSEKYTAPDLMSLSQLLVGEFIDSDVISVLIEIMKTSSPNIQRKAASILEDIASTGVHFSALTDAGVDSAILTVLQELSMAGMDEEYGPEINAVSVEETGLAIAASSRLLTKLLDFEKFCQEIDRLAFVNVLRKILKSSSLMHGKDWAAACLVKIDLMVGCGTDDKKMINDEVTLYGVIPRLVAQMKASPLESREAAVIELNNLIVSKGMLDCSKAFAAAGGIFPLVDVLDKANGPALQAGLAVLYNLSMDTENHVAIISAGAIPIIKKIVLSEGPEWTRALHLLRTLPT